MDVMFRICLLFPSEQKKKKEKKEIDKNNKTYDEIDLTYPKY